MQMYDLSGLREILNLVQFQHSLITQYLHNLYSTLKDFRKSSR
jgi:hypothetical protein